jgi:hypothetical protein
MALRYFAGIVRSWCLVAREDNGMVGTLSSLFVLVFRRAGNFGFFVGRLFDFGSGIGAVGWRGTFSSVFLGKGLAKVAWRSD